MRKKGIAACLLAVICLAGCEKMENDRALTGNMVAVRYWNGEELLFSSDVERGQTPEVYVPETRAGLSFLGWDREIEAACDNGDYYGTFTPALSGHDSYLFPDANGLLHPDAPFSGNALSAALRALPEPEAEA